MTRTILALTSLALFFTAETSFGFAKKPMQISELKGVTETQVLAGTWKANVLVRGKAAELLFKTMKEKQEEQTDTEALKLIGSADGTQWTVRGKRITCSKIARKNAADYACAFDLDQTGSLAAADDVFSPNTFNLAHTETGSKLFKKKSNRSLASVGPLASYNKGLAYLVYNEPGKARNSEAALIVFRGEPAKEILGLLQNNPDNKFTHWGKANGRRGQDIACVEAFGKEPERCAVGVTFRDGATTRDGNPLFY